MYTIVKEETVNTTRSCNPYGSYLNAVDRSEQAYRLHKKKFDSQSHADRVAAVCNIIEKFFGHPVTHLTYRGLGKQAKKPFENIKVAQIGHILSRTPVVRKNENLYTPLFAISNVDVVSKNGHLIIRVYA